MTGSVLDSASTTSVDVLALRFRPQAQQVEIGVSPRKWAPYKGSLALPGVLLLRGERLTEAATRSLSKLSISGDVPTGQCMVFDEPSRDPRGPSLSLAMWATIPAGEDGGEDVEWHSLDDLSTLAFDHNEIVVNCRTLFASMLWRDQRFTRGLTGESFTSKQAFDLTMNLSGAMNKGNFNRLLKRQPNLEARGNVPTTEGGRPPTQWVWAQSH